MQYFCITSARSHSLLFCLMVNSIVYNVNGDYVVEVRTHSYSNPTNRCAGCGANQGCCDNFNELNCTGNLRCDTYFVYCLIPQGINIILSRVIDHCTSANFKSSRFIVPNGDKMIDFSQDTILGLPNPLPLEGTSTVAWNGTQLYIQVIDRDISTHTFFNLSRLNQDDLIDSILIDIPTTTTSVGVETNISTYNGTYGFATLELSFRVVCATNYSGPDCTDFCDSQSCTCREGFTGEFCETNINECIGVTCSGNGACVDGINSFQCDCNSGFTGSLCETNIDDCIDVRCPENSVCVDGINSYQCDCNSGFTGAQCEINIQFDDQCIGLGVRCPENSVCVDDIDSLQCNCISGFTGQLCEINIDDCTGVTCSDNGMCIDKVNSFTCVCNPGFTGQLCEINIDDCAEVDCGESRQCEDGVTSYTCVCDSGITGQFCNETIESEVTLDNATTTTITATNNKTKDSNAAAIIGGSVGGSILLLMILCCTVAAILSVICIAIHNNIGNKNGDSTQIDIKENEAYGSRMSVQPSHNRQSLDDDIEMKENTVYGINNSTPGLGVYNSEGEALQWSVGEQTTNQAEATYELTYVNSLKRKSLYDYDEQDMYNYITV